MSHPHCQLTDGLHVMCWVDDEIVYENGLGTRGSSNDAALCVCHSPGRYTRKGYNSSPENTLAAYFDMIDLGKHSQSPGTDSMHKFPLPRGYSCGNRKNCVCYEAPS